jgi:hypothetical protein
MGPATLGLRTAPETIMATTPTSPADDSASILGKARAFARERPWATATLGVVLAIAGLNSLRGR